MSVSNIKILVLRDSEPKWQSSQNATIAYDHWNLKSSPNSKVNFIEQPTIVCPCEIV
jgi:hypothetical protein